MRVGRLILSPRRWAVAAVALLGLLVLAEMSFAEAGGQLPLALRAARSRGHLLVTWVQPASMSWDLGIRPGDELVSIDARPVTSYTQPSTLARATSATVISPSGQRIITSLQAERATQRQRQASFLALAACFAAVGAVVYVLAADLVTGLIVLGFSLSAAAALLAATATPFGDTRVHIVESVSVACFGPSVVLLFLVFPTNRLKSRTGRLIAIICPGVSLILTGLYLVILAVDASAYGWLEFLAFIMLAGDFAVAIVLALSALTTRATQRHSAGPALALVVLGIIAGLAPFFLVTIVSHLFGIPYANTPEIGAWSMALVPLSLGAAVLSRQFPGTRHLVQRGLVTLGMWVLLVSVYGLGLHFLNVSLAPKDSTMVRSGLPLMILIVALVGTTFTPIFQFVRRTLERAVFHDIYEYASALQRLSDEVADLGSVDAIVAHVLCRLARMLDLSWAALDLSAPGTPRRLYRCVNGIVETNALTVDCNGETPERWTSGDADPVLLVPLRSDESNLGILALGPKRHDMGHLPNDKTFVATLGPLVSTALRNAMLTESLEQQVAALAAREQELAELTVRLMQAQEDERRRIALDLHDEPLQRVILLIRDLSENGSMARASHLQQSAEEISISLRGICLGLRPPMLDDLGLVAGLEWLVSDISARTDVPVSLCIERKDAETFGRLEPNLEVALYRVAQEALTNASKHAHANRMRVSLGRAARAIWLDIADDGKGPDRTPDSTWHAVHLGLVGMRERLRPWGGAVTIASNPAGGTLVAARVELRESYG